MTAAHSVAQATARFLMVGDGAETAYKEDTKVEIRKDLHKHSRRILTLDGELRGRLIRPKGGLNADVDLGILRMSRFRRFVDFLRKGGLPVPGAMLVTDAGVAFMVDDWDTAAEEITNLNFHDSGTGTIAAAVTDTDLGTPAGPTTRATGTKSQPAANQIRSVGTIAYTATLAITEWGLFADATRGAPDTLWDRRVFTAINVVNGDSIQFTYTLTVNSGG